MHRKFLGLSARLIVVALTIALFARALAAATPSEILEKAIYTEETMGDLSAAIALYQQVIAEGKTASAAAAQAQYRLAQVYTKQGKTAEANAALEQLVKDFPNEKDLVAKVRKQLQQELTLQPAPWKDHEALQMSLRLATGYDVGTHIYRIDSAKHEGKDAWRATTRSLTTISAGTFSTVLADKESFAPFSSRWAIPPLGNVEAVYRSDAVEIKDLRNDTTRSIPTEGQALFDNEQCAELMRRLPLAVGGKYPVLVFPTISGQILPMEFEVQGKETVEVPAGKFECFRVLIPLVNQSFFISADANRYLVKLEAGGVTMQLTRVLLLEPGQTTRLETNEYSATIPNDWIPYTTKEGQPEHFTTIYLVDTNSLFNPTISVASRPALREKGASLKSWLEIQEAEFAKTTMDFKIRDGSRAERQVGGLPAVSFIADYLDGESKMVVYNTDVLSEKWAVAIRLRVPPGVLDSYRKQLDTVIDSLRFK